MDLQTAFATLEDFAEGIPFEAIAYLYDHEQPSEEINAKVLYWLEHAYDDIVTYDPETDRHSNAPLWYTIVAERYPSMELVERVIGLFNKEGDDDWDFLNEQGSYLVGLLCEILGDSATERFFRK